MYRHQSLPNKLFLATLAIIHKIVVSLQTSTHTHAAKHSRYHRLSHSCSAGFCAHAFCCTDDFPLAMAHAMCPLPKAMDAGSSTLLLLYGRRDGMAE